MRDEHDTGLALSPRHVVVELTVVDSVLGLRGGGRGDQGCLRELVAVVTWSSMTSSTV